MPWKVTDVMDERMRFVVAAQGGTLSMTSVCASFGISRETAVAAARPNRHQDRDH